MEELRVVSRLELTSFFKSASTHGLFSFPPLSMRKSGLLSLIALCVFGAVSCGTDSAALYPTATAIVGASPSHRGNKEAFALGRKIYTTRCTECHVARPIGQLTIAQWHHVVGIMAPRAELSQPEQSALEAYLVAARESMSGRHAP